MLATPDAVATPARPTARSAAARALTAVPVVLCAAMVLLAPAAAGPARADTGAVAPDPAAPEADPHGPVGQELEPGANSFTEAQVRRRFGTMGFDEVHDLRKDDQGIWHAKAMHAGHELAVRMDFRGNVDAE